jgi:transglutaminase-like putative cysteine protease
VVHHAQTQPNRTARTTSQKLISKTSDPKDLSSLAREIRAAILTDVEDARTRDLGARIVRKYNVTARDQRALVRAVQLHAQAIKFFREFPEIIAAPWVTDQWGIGDCDDKSRMIAAVVKSFRIPVRLVFVTFIKKAGMRVSHVYPEVQLDGRWLPVESVQPWPLGKDPIEMLTRKGMPFTSFKVDI